MPNYAAFTQGLNAAGQGAVDLGDALMKAKAYQRQVATNKIENDYKLAETEKARAQADLASGKAGGYKDASGNTVIPAATSTQMDMQAPTQANLPANDDQDVANLTSLVDKVSPVKSQDTLLNHPAVKALLGAKNTQPAPAVGSSSFRSPYAGETKDQYAKARAASDLLTQKNANAVKLKGTQTGNMSNTGKVTVGGQQFSMRDLNGALKTPERTRVGAVDSGLAAHNQLVDLYEAYHALDGNPSTSSTIMQQLIAKHPNLSSLAQGDPKANIAALYDSAKANSAGETYKIRNGSQATPTDQGYQHLLGLYPNLADDPTKAQGQFNQYYEAQLVPNIAGLQTVMQTVGRDPVTGQWYSPIHKNIYESLGSKMQEMQGKVHNLKQFPVKDGSGVVPGLPGGPAAGGPKAPPVGTVEDGHRFKGGNPADPNSWEKI